MNRLLFCSFIAAAVSVTVALAALPIPTAQASPLWVRTYAGPGHEEAITDMVISRTGCAYIVGECWTDAQVRMVLIKYGPDGTRRWVRHYSPGPRLYAGARAVALSPSGNVVVTGISCPPEATDTAMRTLLYTHTGKLLWSRRYSPSRGGDGALDVQVTPDGSIYVLGFCELHHAGEPRDQMAGDYALLKYDQAGTRLWVRRYDSPAHGRDEPAGVAIHGSTIYVTGSTSDAQFRSTCTTVAWTTEGERLWVATYGTPAELSWWPGGIAIDAAGNIVVSGMGAREEEKKPAFVVKYSPAGELLWGTSVQQASGGRFCSYTRIAADGLGNTYLLADFVVNAVRKDSFVVAKLDGAGQELWRYRYGDKDAAAYDFLVTPSGTCFLCGVVRPSALVLALGPDGAPVFSAILRGRPDRIKEFGSLGLDRLGNVLASGEVGYGRRWQALIAKWANPLADP